MTEQDRPAFALVLHALGEAFNEPVSELRAEAYFDALSDLELDEVQQAARAAIRTQTFFPRPVELRSIIDGSQQDRAEAAWLDLLRMVRRIGYYGTPTFDDEGLRRAVIDVFGGWKACCERLPADGPELLGVAKQFKAAYSVMERRELSARQLPTSIVGFLNPSRES